MDWLCLRRWRADVPRRAIQAGGAAAVGPRAGRVALGWALALALGLALPARAQEENLLDRISNEKMMAFEQKLEKDINAELQRYLAPSQYVLSVRVVWDKNVIPANTAAQLGAEKYKLPGFPIFVKGQGALPDEGAPPFNRLVVKVLLDETLPEYYERFVRKLIPIVARFVQARGDQVVVVKETFPAVQKDQLPPTLPEKELMDQLGEDQGPEQPPPGAPGAKGKKARRQVNYDESDNQETARPAGRQPREGAGAPRLSESQQAQIAYDEGRLPEALGLVQGAFQKALNNEERAGYLAMEGSILYTMKNKEAAIASWKRALSYDPSQMEVRKMLTYLEEQAKKEAQ